MVILSQDKERTTQKKEGKVMTEERIEKIENQKSEILAFLESEMPTNRQLAQNIERKGGLDNLSIQDIDRLCRKFRIEIDMPSDDEIAYYEFNSLFIELTNALKEHSQKTECHLGDIQFWNQENSNVEEDIAEKENIINLAKKCLEVSEKAYSYAKFLGEVVCRDFLSDVALIRSYKESFEK